MNADTLLSILYDSLCYNFTTQIKTVSVKSVVRKLFVSAHSFTTGMLSGRIILMTSYLTAFILISSYCGSLLSYLMVPSFKPPFNNFEEFLNDVSYALGVFPNSAQLDYFKVLKLKF